MRKNRSGEITRSNLRAVLESLEGKLSGEWVLVGGSLLPALGISVRATLDIDLAWKSGDPGTNDTIALMEAVEAAGLPPEAVNTAAAYFLHKIRGFEERLILFKELGSLKIFRPDHVLYVQLKIGRLSETDLQDSIHYLEFESKRLGQLDRKALGEVIQARKKTPLTAGQKENLSALSDALKKFP